MIKKIKYFIFPTFNARDAKQRIEAKKRCLENDENCTEELQSKLKEEMKDLPEDPDKLEELVNREIERKRIIENKSQSFLGIISLIGITLTLLFNLIKYSNIFYTVILSFLIFFECLYVIFSINTILYILSEINIVYEKPLNKSSKELQRVVVLNRYQNLLRTNYLNTIHSNIKRFFFLFLIIFLFYSLCVIMQRCFTPSKSPPSGTTSHTHKTSQPSPNSS